MPFFAVKLLNHEQMRVSDAFESLSSSYGFGVNRKTYDNVKTKLSEKFGREASWLDVTWSVYQVLAEKFAKKGDFEKLSYVYPRQAQFLSEEGEDFQNSLRESFRYRLMHMASLGAHSVWIQAQGCAVCEELKGITYDIKSIELDLPLPPKGCVCQMDKNLKTGYCICDFVAIF